MAKKATFIAFWYFNVFDCDTDNFQLATMVLFDLCKIRLVDQNQLETSEPMDIAKNLKYMVERAGNCNKSEDYELLICNFLKNYLTTSICRLERTAFVVYLEKSKVQIPIIFRVEVIPPIERNQI